MAEASENSSSDQVEKKSDSPVNMGKPKCDRYTKRPGGANMAGELYEMKLAALLFIRCLIAGYPFNIATNMNAAGSFDDIVIGINNELPILMQLKHRSGKVKAVYDNQFTQLNSDFTLLKYCETYWTLKSKWEHDLASCGMFENCVFVLYTNARVPLVHTKAEQHQTNDAAPGKTWQTMLNTGGNFCPILRETHSKIYKAFEDIPNYKRILKERDNVDEMLKAVRVLGNKDAKEVPPDAELDRLAADLEKLKGVDCYEEFLPRVWIFGGQAREQKLNSLIENDIKILLGMDSSITVTNTLLESVQRWWQYDNHFLNEDSRVWQEILQSRSEFLSSAVRNKLLKFPIEYEQEEIKYMEKILSKNSKRIHIYASDSPVLSCLKVLECLKDRKHIIVDRETFQFHQNELMAYSKRNLILVLFSEDSDFASFMKTLDETKLKGEKCRLITVSKCEYGYEAIRDSCDLSQFVKKSREIVLVKCVNFQGLDVPLKCIIGQDEKLLSVVPGNIISQLLTDNKVFIGSVPTKVIEYFINRTLQRKNSIGKEILEENAVFAVSNSNNLRQIVPRGEKVRKYKSGDSIELSCRFFEITAAADFEDLSKSFRNIHWLQRNGDLFHWIQSKGDIHVVKKYIARGATATFSNILSLSERLVVLVAEPGMGKSTLMSYIALELKKLKRTSWVLKINLNDYAEYLGEENASPLGLLERALKINDDFQKNLLQQSLNVIGNVAVLLDGFDEISPDYADQVIGIMQKLVLETRVEQIWVTSRPVMKEKLEETFCTLSYILKPFSTDDQKAFLHKFWNVGYIEDFANKLLEFTGRWLNDKLGQFTGIPLQTMMLAEAFREEMMHFRNTGENSLPEKLDLLQLYERFIETKLKIYFREKLNADMHNVGMKAVFESISKDFYDKHMVCAVLSLFSQEELSKLQYLQHLKGRVKDFLLDVQMGKEKTGIIMNVNNERPTFIHRTFEEYFAALWLMTNYENYSGLVEHLLFSPTFEIMRIFFDRALTRNCILHVAILNQDVESVKQLLLSEQTLATTVDKGNRTALHLAVMNYIYRISEKPLKQKRRNILQEIIHSGADVNVCDFLMHWTPIQYASRIKAWEAMELLMVAGADTKDLNVSMSEMNPKDFSSKVLPILLRKGYINIIKFYLSINPKSANSLFPVNHEFQTVMFSPLHEAARWGHKELVQLLLDAGADMEYVDTLCKETPLMWAARSNKWHVVQLLLNKGANGNVQGGRDGVSVLQLAAEFGDETLIEMLLTKHGLIEQINSTAHNGATPLIRAAKLKNWGIAKILLEKGASTACMLQNGLTPLHLAVKSGEETIVPLILRNDEVRRRINAKVRGGEGDTILTTAARAGYWGIVQELMKFGANSPNVAHLVAIHGKDSTASSLLNNPEISIGINDLNEAGLTPLMQAAKNKNWVMFKEILKRGGKVAPGSENSSLHFAISSRSVSLVQFVLENTDNEKVGPLNEHLVKAVLSALRFGMLDVSKVLISKYPEILDTRSVDGSTVLHLAADSGNTDLLQYLLLDKNLVHDIDCVDNKGDTPIFRAVMRGNIEATFMLDDHGADTAKTNNRGESIAHAAARNGLLELAEWLVDMEIDPMQPDDYGVTPLHVAANSRRFAYVQWLITAQNASVNVCDNLNRPPIAFAVGDYNLEMTELLIQHGAEVNYRSQDDKTLLHIAAKDYRIAKLLLETDAIQPDVKDNLGRTPLYLAIQGASLESVELLLQAGANPAVRDNSGVTPLDLLNDVSFTHERKKHKVHKLMKMLQKKK